LRSIAPWTQTRTRSILSACADEDAAPDATAEAIATEKKSAGRTDDEGFLVRIAVA
jgi:hypothetical protein